MSSDAARAAEADALRRMIGWEWPQVCKRLRISYQAAGALRNGKGEISDVDLDYLRRMARAVEAVPRGEDDMAVKESVLAAALEVYAESYALGEDGAGARHAVGELLAKVGWLDEARARLAAVAAVGPAMPGEPDEPESQDVGRVPFGAGAQA
jgi:hypothetical protein